MEIKDPAIKLFGKTIPLAGDGQDSPRDSNSSSYSSPHLDYVDKELAEEETMDTESDEKDENESSNDAKNPQQKTLKKPDKILPCPRCNSMDTKFCYYNNYNVNQPRHFCKSCQRYWTAGGTMRNVPVGSGRRKNKTSPYCNLTIHPELKSNGTLLTFGSDDPSSGSTVTTTSSIEKGPQQEPVNQNGFFPNQIPCFQWPTYMWNSPFCPSAFPMPMPFYPPPPYWNIHWAPPTCPPTLGKHSRDGEDPTVLVPKTLRIDDPDEAAKSSIWTTLGINKEKGESKGKEGGFFNSIHFKDQKSEGSSAAFKANPAALCRSDTFQENNR